MDLIDRQAAIDVLQEEINKGIPPFDDTMGAIRCGVRLARNIIEDLPSAQPERIRGKWEYVDYGGFGNYHCTACRSICICNGDYDFCPNCGADMRGEQNETA